MKFLDIITDVQSNIDQLFAGFLIAYKRIHKIGIIVKRLGGALEFVGNDFFGYSVFMVVFISQCN